MKALKEAPKQVTIEVTQTDINKGTQGSMKSCAIARAVKRTMGDSQLEVDDSSIRIEIAQKFHVYNIPKLLRVS